jgi:hypothetical protein
MMRLLDERRRHRKQKQRIVGDKALLRWRIRVEFL